MDVSAARVLIVDDEPKNRRLLEALLLPEGYSTSLAVSGEQALEMIASAPPDLILLDIMMPGMDGYAVAERLKGDPVTASIPIIMLTAHLDPKARLAGLSAGAEDFLVKPVDRTELWLRVRNLLRLKMLADFFQNHSLLLEAQVQSRTLQLQLFRSAMDATADAILLVSRSSMCFVEVNATACKLFGYSREQFLALGPHHIGVESREDLEAAYDALIGGNTQLEQREVELIRQDGSSVQAEVYRHSLQAGTDCIIVAAVRDISERKLAELRLHKLAHYDALTGLPNRGQFNETLQRTLAFATEHGEQTIVMFLDIDHFKRINDTLGHAVGDQLLHQVSDRLVACLRLRDTVGRLGGDEFGLILLTSEGHMGATAVAKKLQAALQAPFSIDGHSFTVTVSIGITIHPDDSSDAATLLKYADTAMYRSKYEGRDTFRFFTSQMNVEVFERVALETALREALDRNEFELHYQPKVRLDTGVISGLEALLRWNRPGYGLVYPNDFVPVLEEMGLIVKVGAWVQREACRQIAEWGQSTVGPMHVSVNVSSRQFVDGGLEASVLEALQLHAIQPSLLELELTESSMMVDTQNTIVTLQNLQQLGVQVSIDDFGTGYSSLAYLRRFPIDKLKIDIAFTRDITDNDDDATIALAIITMAKSLRLSVIAEGVETPQQSDYLRRHGCDEIQGYLFSRPLPGEQVAALIERNRATPWHGAAHAGA